MTNDRLKHSLSVAKKMKEIVKGKKQIYKFSPDEAFILGMLHDIGYEFCITQEEHAHIGGEVLKNQGYKFWKEIYFHGVPQEEYSSAELWLLNYVDMITHPNGEYISIHERIEDIEKRYGKDSLQVEEARELAKILNYLY